MFRASKAEGYVRAQARAAELKRLATSSRDLMAAGNVSINALDQLQGAMVDSLATWAEVAAIPGIAAYATAQEGDAGYDIAAEFSAMNAAAGAVRDYVEGALPKDGSGYVAAYKYEPDHSRSFRVFTPAQTATLRGLLDDLIAAID